MGLFSKRRSDGFDPDLWSDADERAEDRGSDSWFDDLDVSDGSDGGLDDLETNAVVSFDDTDKSWLSDDPGEKVRRKTGS